MSETKRETKLKVLFAASECLPFVKTGGLADVAGALPAQLCRDGADARIVLPFYKPVKENTRRSAIMCAISSCASGGAASIAA